MAKPNNNIDAATLKTNRNDKQQLQVCKKTGNQILIQLSQARTDKKPSSKRYPRYYSYFISRLMTILGLIIKYTVKVHHREHMRWWQQTLGREGTQKNNIV
jgi:hypothetical protein